MTPIERLAATRCTPFALPALSTVFMTTPTNDIPAITDPLGRSWRNPQGVHEAVMDDEFVWLTHAQVDDLHEYSSSYPTGTYDGKCWKRARDDGGWWLCWFGPCPIPGRIAIEYRNIIVKEQS